MLENVLLLSSFDHPRGLELLPFFFFGQKPNLKAASLRAFAKLYTEKHFIIKGKNILRI